MCMLESSFTYQGRNLFTWLQLKDMFFLGSTFTVILVFLASLTNATRSTTVNGSSPAVITPSPEVQPPPTNLTELLDLITSNAEGTQFQFINFLGFNLNVGHFITHDNAPVISLTTNTTGPNSAVSRTRHWSFPIQENRLKYFSQFIFTVLSPGDPFLVTIQDVISGSYLSYSLAGTGITHEFSPATINSNIKLATIFEVNSISGTGFRSVWYYVASRNGTDSWIWIINGIINGSLTEATGKTLLTSWPDAGNPFSPVRSYVLVL